MDNVKLIWLNGQWLEQESAVTNVLSHGLHYGTSVFEGERIYNGNVFRLHDHSQRLIDSAKMLGFDLPYSVDVLNQATKELVARLEIQTGYVRPVAWLDDTSLAMLPSRNKVNVAIAAWNWPDLFDEETRTIGLRLGYSKWMRQHPKAAPVAAKAGGNYLNSVLAIRDVRSKGFDEALLLDFEGYIAEATGANIFFVEGQKLVTPIADRFLNGITRQTVIHIANALDIEVEQRRIQPAEVAKFDGAFLCGTAYEVLPVHVIGDFEFDVPTLTRQIIDQYQTLCVQGWE